MKGEELMIQMLPLSGHHNRKDFDCGNEDLNRWFIQMAGQQKAKGVSLTYVAVESEISTRVLGFYSLNITEIIGDELPLHSRRKLPNEIPAFKIGRLAVAKQHWRNRLGSLMLANAISRIRRIATEVGGVLVVVDAKDESIGFYKQYGFEEMKDHHSKLFLML